MGLLVAERLIPTINKPVNREDARDAKKIFKNRSDFKGLILDFLALFATSR